MSEVVRYQGSPMLDVYVKMSYRYKRSVSPNRVLDSVGHYGQEVIGHYEVSMSIESVWIYIYV